MASRTDREPIGAALRISGVTVPRKRLEDAIAYALDRFEEGSAGKLSYGQLNIPLQGGLWAAILEVLSRTGSNIASLIEVGLIGSADLDLAFAFFETDFAISLSIPSPIVEALGRGRVSITVSFYPTSDSDGGVAEGSPSA